MDSLLLRFGNLSAKGLERVIEVQRAGMRNLRQHGTAVAAMTLG